jgi:hypothetical protein
MSYGPTGPGPWGGVNWLYGLLGFVVVVVIVVWLLRLLLGAV